MDMGLVGSGTAMMHSNSVQFHHRGQRMREIKILGFSCVHFVWLCSNSLAQNSVQPPLPTASAPSGTQVRESVSPSATEGQRLPPALPEVVQPAVDVPQASRAQLAADSPAGSSQKSNSKSRYYIQVRKRRSLTRTARPIPLFRFMYRGR